MLPTERIALCTARLLQGRAMTVRQVAEELEITHSGAAKLLARISRVLPVVDEGGVWRVMERDPFEYDDPHDIRHALARQEAKRVFGESEGAPHE